MKCHTSSVTETHKNKFWKVKLQIYLSHMTFSFLLLILITIWFNVIDHFVSFTLYFSKLKCFTRNSCFFLLQSIYFTYSYYLKVLFSRILCNFQKVWWDLRVEKQTAVLRYNSYSSFVQGFLLAELIKARPVTHKGSALWGSHCTISLAKSTNFNLWESRDWTPFSELKNVLLCLSE